MATSSDVSVEEYLHTVYRPDCDYLDGRVVERNLGEKDHARAVAMVAHLLLSRREEWGIHAFMGQRLRVKANRVHVVDLCVYASAEPEEQVFTTPPLLCIEVVSPEDRWTAMWDRLQDYVEFGVPHIWIIDPTLRRAWRATTAGVLEITELIIPEPPIRISFSELFR